MIKLRINEYNDKFYYIKGTNIFHREDGPGVELANGSKFWYQHGKYHREDGPAVELANGDKKWYHNGKCHRLDGPAVELANGDKSWFLDDKKINCTSQQEFENSVEFRSFKLRAFW